MDTLFVFEDFTRLQPGPVSRTDDAYRQMEDEIGKYYACPITTEELLACREVLNVDMFGRSSGVAAAQYLTVGAENVKAGSKLHVMVRATGDHRFYISFYGDVNTNKLVKTSANSEWLMVICTELGLITLKDTLDTRSTNVETVDLTDEEREAIRNREFRIGFHQYSGLLLNLTVSEVDLEGNGLIFGRLTGSNYNQEYVREPSIEGSFDSGDEIVTVSNKYNRLSASPFTNSVGLHKLVAQERYLDRGKRLVLLDSSGNEVYPSRDRVRIGSAAPISVWFISKENMQDAYRFKLVDV